jgi:hypothetical protein
MFKSMDCKPSYSLYLSNILKLNKLSIVLPLLKTMVNIFLSFFLFWLNVCRLPLLLSGQGVETKMMVKYLSGLRDMSSI